MKHLITRLIPLGVLLVVLLTTAVQVMAQPGGHGGTLSPYHRKARIDSLANQTNAFIVVNTDFKLINGTPGVGKVLTSDAAGLATWQPAAGGADGNGIFDAANNGGSVPTAYAVALTDKLNFDSNTLAIDGTNNRVGIGIGTPLTTLDILGTFRLDDGLQQLGYVLTSDATGKGSWQAAAGGNTIYTADDALAGPRIVSQAGFTLDFTGTVVDMFSVDGTTFSVDGLNNRVGIGNSAPTAKLDITGTLKASDDVNFDANTFFVDASANRVGIGTAAPAAPLHIASAGNLLIDGSTSAVAKLSIQGSTTASQMQVVGGAALDAGISITTVPSAATTSFYGVDVDVNTANAVNTRGGSFLARQGTGTNIAVYGQITNSAGSNKAMYGLHSGGGTGTTQWGGHFVHNAATTGISYGVQGEANANAPTGTKFGGHFTASGTSVNNTALYASATGGTLNYGLVVASGSVGIGTTSPNAGAILDITSATQAVLLPRLTAGNASAITPVNGMILYATSTDATFTSVGVWAYEAGAWVKL